MVDPVTSRYGPELFASSPNSHFSWVTPNSDAVVFPEAILTIAASVTKKYAQRPDSGCAIDVWIATRRIGGIRNFNLGKVAGSGR